MSNMGPLKKPKCVKSSASNISADDGAPRTPTAQGTTAAAASFTGCLSLSELDALYDNLIQTIRTESIITSSSSSITNNTSPSRKDKKREHRLALSSSLLTLKSWQQDLLMELEASERQLHQARVQNQRQKRTLAALAYEKQHLDQELETCRNFELKYLKQLAAEEVGGGGASNSAAISTDMDTDVSLSNEKQLLSNFLQANVHDPNDKQRIIARLHQELNARGSLERDLKLKQQELQTLQEQLSASTQFLQALPDHLHSLERASVPLQKFMATKQPDTINSSNNNNNNSNAFYNAQCARMIGTERQQRLELAQTLPPPLYTLFAQLQHSLDHPILPAAAAAKEDDENRHVQYHVALSTNVSLHVVDGPDSSDKQVVLQIAVPDVSSGKRSTNSSNSKIVKIQFQYQQGRVSAAARGSGTALNQDVLLEELFPHDKGIEMTTSTATTTTTSPSYYAYHWCNYLAGLHTVPDVLPSPASSTSSSSSTTTSRSTRVIVRELQRRVRANATLKHILHSLQRQRVPLPPGGSRSMTSRSSSSAQQLQQQDDGHCKLRQFVLIKSNNHIKTFAVSLSKGDATWQMQVDIHMARYPVVPPVWNLNNAPPPPENSTTTTDTTATTPLYDDHLAALERYVNADGLEELTAAAQPQHEHEDGVTRPSNTTAGNDETAYEWILLYQFRHILESLGNDGGGFTGRSGGGGRTFKGRDHVPITET